MSKYMDVEIVDTWPSVATYTYNGHISDGVRVAAGELRGRLLL
jgi:hypothetical protein